MGNEMRDAKRALGWGFAFFAYAAWLAFDHLRQTEAFRNAWRNWANDNPEAVEATRSRLLSEEGITNGD